MACEVRPSSHLAEGSPRKGTWVVCWGTAAGWEKQQTEVCFSHSGLKNLALDCIGIVFSGLKIVSENRANPEVKETNHPFIGTYNFLSTAAQQLPLILCHLGLFHSQRTPSVFLLALAQQLNQGLFHMSQKDVEAFFPKELDTWLPTSSWKPGFHSFFCVYCFSGFSSVQQRLRCLQ